MMSPRTDIDKTFEDITNCMSCWRLKDSVVIVYNPLIVVFVMFANTV